MTSSSDEWLLALLDEKSTNELSAVELAALRERATASPALRDAILKRIRFDESMHAALGSPQISGSEVIRYFKRRRRNRLITAAAMLVLLIAGSSALFFALRGFEVPAPPKAADVVAQDGKPTPEIPEETAPDDPPTPPSEKPGEAAPPPVEATTTEPPSVASPEPPKESNWWDEVLGDNAPIVPFETSAFAPFGESVPGFDVADEFPAIELRRIVADVAGLPLNISEGQWRNRKFASLEGVGQVLPPWRDDAVLRIAPFDIAEFALHLWNENRGVSIRFYPHQRPHLLAGYAIERETESPTPTKFQLLSTDGGSYARANAGAIEIRHQAGNLVVTHGAVMLLGLPMESAPTEVVLEGRMKLRTLAMYRGEPAPQSQPVARRPILAEKPLDQWEWITSTEPAAKLEVAEGRATLLPVDDLQPKSRQIVWAGIPLPANEPSGLTEAIFRLDQVAPGTGVYLGDEKGSPIHTLFMTENQILASPMAMYGWTSRDGTLPEPRWRWDLDPKNELTPVVGPGTWLKLVVGPGGLKAYVSGDGEHWGPCSRTPERAVRGTFASVGMFAMADGKPRTIGLSKVHVRELSGIASATSPELRQRVPPFETPTTRPADWLTWATATRPNEVPLNEWLAACAVETLARGNASDSVLKTVLEGLITDSITARRPIYKTLALIADAALLSDVWNDRVREFASHYSRLATHVAMHEPDATTIAAALHRTAVAYLSAPIWTENRPWAIPPEVARNIAAAAVWSNDPTAATAARQVAYYLTPSHPERGWATDEELGLTRITSWAAELSAAGGRQLDGASRFGWGHPLSTEPGREATAVALELEAALSAGAYGDAARLLGTITDLSGLMPAPNDPDRFIPPSRLIAEVASQHPSLIDTIESESGAVALLAVKQAIATKDDAAVRTAALRYIGTAAAVEANQWLGDAALALGRFSAAIDHFEQAANATSPEQRATITARLKLAETLAGQSTELENLPQASFGTQTLSQGQFQGLIEDLQKSRSTADEAVTASQTTIPKSSAVVPEARGRFEGDLGRDPGKGEFQRFDWAGRQIGVTSDRGILYLTNRFQVVAFDANRQRPLWTAGLGKEQGDTHAWPNVAFKPVVQGDQLFVRRLTTRGPELASLRISGRGKAIWRTASEVAVVSDPLVMGGGLVAITAPADRRGGGLSTLSLTLFRTDDGTQIVSVPLFVMSDPQSMQPPVELLATNEGLILTTLGTAARCDWEGNIVWLRKLPFLPPAADPDADRLPYSPPLLAGDRVLIAPPGSRSVIALDAATGRQLWTRPLGELEGSCGLADSAMILKGTETVLALDVATGQTRWTLHKENLLEGIFCDAQTVLASTRTDLGDQQDGLSLLRIDAATGSLFSEQTIRVQRKEPIRCGPLFVENDHVWGFIGEGWRDPKRTLVEFVPNDSLPPVRSSDDPGDFHGWRSHVEPQTDFNTASVLPGWTPMGSQSSGNSKKGAEFRDEHAGEQWVLLTKAGRDQSAQFMKRVNLPAGQPKLNARVGRNNDEGWTLRLLVDGREIAGEPVSKATAPDGWRTVSFNLARFEGKEVQILLEQSPPQGQPDRNTEAFWKQIVIE